MSVSKKSGDGGGSRGGCHALALPPFDPKGLLRIKDAGNGVGFFQSDFTVIIIIIIAHFYQMLTTAKHYFKCFVCTISFTLQNKIRR